MQQALDDHVDAFLAPLHQPDAVVSVWAGTTDGRTVLARQADVAHYAASTMKLPLVVAAYRLHDRGELDLDTGVPVRDTFASVFDGSPFTMSHEDDQDDETWDARGSVVPLRELARRAITRSSNIATNLLVDRVGLAEVAAVLADAGCSATTVLPRGLEDPAARRAGINNLVTAADLGRVMAGVAARTLATPGSCTEVEAVLAAQEYRDQIPAGLPAGTYVANKTGWVGVINHDVALIRPDGRDPYVLAVCTSIDVPQERASALIADISRLVWEGWRR